LYFNDNRCYLVEQEGEYFKIPYNLIPLSFSYILKSPEEATSKNPNTLTATEIFDLYKNQGLDITLLSDPYQKLPKINDIRMKNWRVEKTDEIQIATGGYNLLPILDNSAD